MEVKSVRRVLTVGESDENGRRGEEEEECLCLSAGIRDPHFYRRNILRTCKKFSPGGESDQRVTCATDNIERSGKLALARAEGLKI